MPLSSCFSPATHAGVVQHVLRWRLHVKTVGTTHPYTCKLYRVLYLTSLYYSLPFTSYTVFLFMPFYTNSLPQRTSPFPSSTYLPYLPPSPHLHGCTRLPSFSKILRYILRVRSACKFLPNFKAAFTAYGGRAGSYLTLPRHIHKVLGVILFFTLGPHGLRHSHIKVHERDMPVLSPTPPNEQFIKRVMPTDLNSNIPRHNFHLVPGL